MVEKWQRDLVDLKQLQNHIEEAASLEKSISATLKRRTALATREMRDCDQFLSFDWIISFTSSALL